MATVWSEQDWRVFEQKTSASVRAGSGVNQQQARVARSARKILQTYSTSFFIVTRFLPPAKRDQVEIIYAAVRYPDEVVDTFPLSPEQRMKRLDAWRGDYERGLECDFKDAVAGGANCFAAAFADVVKRNAIPREFYGSFLDAMRLDVTPRPFATLDDLIESYVYGSAIVVGFFLAYVYGPSAPREFPRALEASRSLGIALQLTNFLRDVREDQRRGRVYLPVDLQRAEGLVSLDAGDDADERIHRVLRRLSAAAEEYYRAAERDLDSFAPDCRVAIQACIDVYRELNLRIGRSRAGMGHRESVPMADKFRVLPPSKYWRLPLAYLGAI